MAGDRGYGALFLGILLLLVSATAGKTLEKDELTLGFIKLTDCAPVIIAKEKGFFEEEGLYVTVQAQANWKVLLDRVISGELDGAHMLPGQAIGATIGFGTQADIVAPVVMGLNTLAVTVSNDVWMEMKKDIPHQDGKPIHPIKADALKPLVEKYKAEGKSFPMGMVFPTSTHNYHLRYWLAAGGLHPGLSATDISGQLDADVLISVDAAAADAGHTRGGTIYGYSVGEPWNQQAVFKGIGSRLSRLTTFGAALEKIFGMRKDFTEKYPNTTLALVKAILRAEMWLDEDNGKIARKPREFFQKRNTSARTMMSLSALSRAFINMRRAIHGPCRSLIFT